MRSFYVLIIVVFLGIWGMGIFLSYLGTFGKSKMPTLDSMKNDPALLEEQKRVVSESEDMRKKAMEDYEYQRKHYKNTLPGNPPSSKF